jgi:hypothetical protein
MNYAGHLLAAVALTFLATVCASAPAAIVQHVAAVIETIAPEAHR